MTGGIAVTIEFSGGAELLFGNVKQHHVTLPQCHDNASWTLGALIPWIKDNLLKERSELFMQGESVRPGILVIVNDADWEILGEHNYVIQEKDHIVFISTLHGG